MWQDAFPCKLKRIFIVGGSTWLLHAIRLMVALLGKKLRDRIRVLHHKENLQKYIPPEQLPAELGGSLELDWEGWVNKALWEEENGTVRDEVWSPSF